MTCRTLLPGVAGGRYCAGVAGALVEPGLAAATPSATDPADLGVLEALSLLRTRALGARELLAACRARIARHEPTVQAFAPGRGG